MPLPADTVVVARSLTLALALPAIFPTGATCRFLMEAPVEVQFSGPGLVSLDDNRVAEVTLTPKLGDDYPVQVRVDLPLNRFGRDDRVEVEAPTHFMRSQPTVIHVEPTPITVENYLETPPLQVTFDRDKRTGARKGATIQDA